MIFDGKTGPHHVIGSSVGNREWGITNLRLIPGSADPIGNQSSEISDYLPVRLLAFFPVRISLKTAPSPRAATASAHNSRRECDIAAVRAIRCSVDS